MNKEQAKKETKKIFHERNQKAHEIIENAKKNGTWKMGLDSNKELFAELDKETQSKLKHLRSLVDEE